MLNCVYDDKPKAFTRDVIIYFIEISKIEQINNNINIRVITRLSSLINIATLLDNGFETHRQGLGI